MCRWEKCKLNKQIKRGRGRRNDLKRRTRKRIHLDGWGWPHGNQTEETSHNVSRLAVPCFLEFVLVSHSLFLYNVYVEFKKESGTVYLVEKRKRFLSTVNGVTVFTVSSITSKTFTSSVIRDRSRMDGRPPQGTLRVPSHTLPRLEGGFVVRV